MVDRGNIVDGADDQVRAIGRVAVEVDGVARMAMPVLLELIEMKVNHVVSSRQWDGPDRLEWSCSGAGGGRGCS